MTWMTLSAAGKNVSCTTPQTPGTPHSSCWMWRRRCGAHYINLEPNANEGHLNYTNITPPISFCDPGDGLGLGFAKRTTPPCPNWAAEPVSTITPHGPSYSLTLWVENRIGGNPVLFDFNYISVASAAMKVSVKDAAGTWWVIAASLAPNTPGTYYDITNQGWEITQAVMTNANPGELTAVAGLYYLTPN